MRRARTKLLRDTGHGLNVRMLSRPIIRDRAGELRSLLSHHLSVLRDLTLQASNHPLSRLLLKLLSVLWWLNGHAVPWWSVLSLGGESNTVLKLLLVLGYLLEIWAMDCEGPSKIVGKALSSSGDNFANNSSSPSFFGSGPLAAIMRIRALFAGFSVVGAGWLFCGKAELVLAPAFICELGSVKPACWPIPIWDILDLRYAMSKPKRYVLYIC